MEVLGKLTDIQMNPITKKGSITFEVEDWQQAMVEYDALKDRMLRITAKKYRPKRSLSANAYFWVLLTEMAKVLHTDAESLHKRYVKEHPYVWQDEDGKPCAIAIHANVDVEKRLPCYWMVYGEQKGNLVQYLRIKGTSEMNSQEMAIVLDDVVEEARSLGIQTATPDEIERMKMYGDMARY